MPDTVDQDPLVDWLVRYSMDLARQVHSEAEVQAMRPMMLVLAELKAVELRQLTGEMLPQGGHEPTN